jgi:hypothetical protein
MRGFSGWSKRGSRQPRCLIAFPDPAGHWSSEAATEAAHRRSAGDALTGIRTNRPRRLDPEAYRQLCREVLERDGWRCQSCGQMGNLQVHHIQWRSRLGNDTAENLIRPLRLMPSQSPSAILKSACLRFSIEIIRSRHITDPSKRINKHPHSREAIISKIREKDCLPSSGWLKTTFRRGSSHRFNSQAWLSLFGQSIVA